MACKWREEEVHRKIRSLAGIPDTPFSKRGRLLRYRWRQDPGRFHLAVFRFSHDSGSLIPPWAFCERNLSGFLSLKRPRVLRDLRILPTVEEETVKPSFLRRIPPGVFEPVPQALRSTGASGSFWASRFILPGSGGFWD